MCPQHLPMATCSQQEPEDGEKEQGKERDFVSGTALEVTRCRKMTLSHNNLPTFVNTAVTVRMCCIN